jgi:hypothetical protein
MTGEKNPCAIHKENGDVFITVAGVKIAKRRSPGTARADTWIILQPGWVVRNVKGGTEIEVEYQHGAEWRH